MLVLLFAVTVVRLSHTHSSNLASSGKNKKVVKLIGTPCYDISTLSNSCFICDYQLTKDTDTSPAEFKIDKPAEFNTFFTVTYLFTLQSLNTVFETRGPPFI